jgi:hypothetical protein
MATEAARLKHKNPPGRKNKKRLDTNRPSHGRSWLCADDVVGVAVPGGRLVPGAEIAECHRRAYATGSKWGKIDPAQPQSPEEIIGSFPLDTVRFIRGEEPSNIEQYPDCVVDSMPGLDDEATTQKTK